MSTLFAMEHFRGWFHFICATIVYRPDIQSLRISSLASSTKDCSHCTMTADGTSYRRSRIGASHSSSSFEYRAIWPWLLKRILFLHGFDVPDYLSNPWSYVHNRLLWFLIHVLPRGDGEITECNKTPCSKYNHDYTAENYPHLFESWIRDLFSYKRRCKNSFNKQEQCRNSKHLPHIRYLIHLISPLFPPTSLLAVY